MITLLLSTLLFAENDRLALVIRSQGWCSDGIRIERVSLSRPWPLPGVPKVLTDPPVGLVRFQVGEAGGTAFVRCFDKVLISSREIGSGEVFDGSNTRLSPLEISTYVRTGFFRDLGELSDFESKGFVVRGRVIGRLETRRKQLVKAGSKVTVVFETPGVRIEGDGTAIQSGTMNELVRVSNTRSRKVIVARVSGAGTVTTQNSHEKN